MTLSAATRSPAAPVPGRPAWSAPRFALFAVALSLSLLLLGHMLVLQARPHGPTPYLDVATDGDPIYYHRMATGRLDEVRPPFRYRLLAPALAALLPLPAFTALAAVSYLGLFGCYLLGLICCRRLGIGPAASAAGLFMAYSTTYHLYNYYDPFLTDALGTLFLFVMTWALLAGSFPVFLVAGLAGVLTRESALFLAPAWCAISRWRQAVAATAAVLAAYGTVRILLAPPGESWGGYLASSWQQAALWRHLPAFVLALASAWGFVWVAAPVGWRLLPRPARGRLAVAGLLLLGGALASCFFANFPQRMFGVLIPVMVITGAAFFQALWPRLRALAVGLGGLCVAQAAVTIPTRLAPWAYDSRLPRVAIYVLGTAIILAAMPALRREWGK